MAEKIINLKAIPKKVRYNSPVVLTFAIIATVVMVIDSIFPGFTKNYFTMYPRIASLLDWFRMFSYVLGHGNWQHLFSNMMMFLLIGPIVEEKYGSKKTLIMIAITALVGGLFHVTFMNSGGLGASGIVFMFILLVSIVNIRKGEIPVTFIIVAALFLGQEIANMSRCDNVSQVGHLLGGICGAAFGFWFNGRRRR